MKKLFKTSSKWSYYDYLISLMAGFVIRDIWLLLCYYCMPQLRVVQRSLTGQSVRFEVTHWCKRLSSTGLLQRPTDRSSAANIHPEYRRSSRVEHDAGPRYPILRKPPLASGAAKDRFLDRSPCVKICRCIAVSIWNSAWWYRMSEIILGHGLHRQNGSACQEYRQQWYWTTKLCILWAQTV